MAKILPIKAELTRQPKPQRCPRDKAQEELFDLTMAGLANRVKAQGLKIEKIAKSRAHVVEFMEYSNKFPWQWKSDDFEDFCAHLADDLGNSTATQRKKQSDIKQYLDYVRDSKYTRVIEQELGIVLDLICHKDNMIVHKVENDNTTHRRKLTRPELKLFFNTLDDHIIFCENTGNKNFQPAQRDKAIFALKTFYGLRTNEESHIDIDDFAPNPDYPEFGNFGRLEVWYGKATKGSNPIHRTVWCTDLQCAQIIQWYITEVRPLFIGRNTKNEDLKALFFSERGARISNRSIQINFKKYLRMAGLPDGGALVPHSLRKSFVSNDQEDGHTNTHFAGKQVGHKYSATTHGYEEFSDDFYKKCRDDTINRKLEKYRKRRRDEDSS
ncbi:MAG TPA: hypothetical protein DCP92_02090 [Nitrospiraceae bacterium]|jgi:site-specific recombinase XerD|nr:hypothetical protein [Nitrospiraceae bacterium]